MLEQKFLTAKEIDYDLNHRAGLLGLSGKTGDMKELQRLSSEGNNRARLAIEIYAQSVASHICALMSWMEGADAILFTAGIGENSASIRESVAQRLSFLGVKLNDQLNQTCTTDTDISAGDATIQTLVVRTKEEWSIAQDCAHLLAKAAH
jgi:acetate kinase